MNILYASNICSDREFKRIYDMCSNIKPLQSIQKFNKLLGKGLKEHKDVKLDIITSAPINREMCKKIFWKQKEEDDDGILYHYCFMMNIPIIKFITLFFSSMLVSLKWSIKNRRNKDNFVIYDAYCPIIANVTAIIANMFKIKVIALYTDVPKCMKDNLEKRNKFKTLLKSIYEKVDNVSNRISMGYILLTEQMNEVVNLNNKPYVVVEGLADKDVPINNVEKYNDFIIMYAGGLYEKFGILNIIKAIKEINNEKIKLLLYGNGELEDILNSEYKDDKNIKYKGILENDKIVEEEQRATILVNPRFSNEEYTKYSFPSKNMEYMASGTPTLTTKLPGIPKEYYEYIYLIEDETVEGMKKTIMALFNMDRDELSQKGLKAREFILKNKNNKIQAKKIIDFMIENQ